MSVPGTEVDALFRLPLGEFTSARNALVARLKKAGRQEEASEAKALTKPSVSAWVVNQLYWRHRGLFDRLIEAGDRMRRAQTAQTTGDDARDSAHARREAVTALTKIAEGLLLGGHYGATRDMLRRVTGTLEALSSYGSRADAPPAGRLTDDVAPPGFEALGGLVVGGGKSPAREPAKNERKRSLAATKAIVRDAERTLSAARRQAERAAARLDAATARASALERRRARTEKQLTRASNDVVGARRDASEAAAGANAATAAVARAEQALESARRELRQIVGKQE